MVGHGAHQVGRPDNASFGRAFPPGLADWLQRLRAPPSRADRQGRRRPAHGVADHLLDERLMVGRIGLVAGAEVEDPALAAPEAAAAAEDLPALKPAHEYQLVRGRDVEMLAVHLLG